MKLFVALDKASSAAEFTTSYGQVPFIYKAREEYFFFASLSKAF